MPAAEKQTANGATAPAVPAQTKTGSLDSGSTPFQQITVIVDKKIRNLDKRKTRLEQLKEQAKDAPKELNVEQKKALAKYEEVIEIVEFFKDFKKQINGIFQEAQKSAKLKEQKDKAERVKEEKEKIRNILVFQDLLIQIGRPEIKQALKSGAAGIEPVTEEQFKVLDDLYEITTPKRNEPGFQKNVDVAASRLSDLVDGKKKDLFKGVSYQDTKDLLNKIDKCPILTSSSEKPPSPPAEEVVNSNQPQTGSPNVQQMHQNQPHDVQPSFVSFGSIDTNTSTDPAIVSIYPGGGPEGHDPRYFVPYPAMVPASINLGQFPPGNGMNPPVNQQQMNEPQPQESQRPSQPISSIPGMVVEGKQQFKNQRGGKPGNYNRGPRDGPRNDYKNRNHDNRNQGAPSDFQRNQGYRGPRNENNNIPNGFKGPRNNNGNAGPRPFNGPRPTNFQKAQ